MLPLQFFGQNIHFAISLFATLVFFAIFWLHLDAWTSSKERKELVNASGFLLVALSFLVESTVIEQSVLGHSTLDSVSQTLVLIIRSLGFGAIIIGQLIDPLQKKPETKGLNAEEFMDDSSPNAQVSDTPPSATTKRAQAVGFGSIANASHLILPLGAGAIAGLYWRRATIGLERHLKPVAVGFAFLAGFELLSLADLWRGSANPQIAQLVAAFGVVWILQQILLLTSVVILGTWVWRYLTLRFFSQIFMIFTTLTLAIFLVTAVSFTFLLTRDVQRSSLDNLKTAANVLSYALNGKKNETLANAITVAENPAIVTATQSKDSKALANLTNTFLHDRKQSSLIITSSGGQVLLRAEDPERYGDSLSADTLVRRALIGQSTSSIRTRNGVLAPLVYISSATPMRDANNQIIGTVTVSLVADNAFVDGIKQATGLDSAVYADNVRSATTFLASDGVSRLIGAKDINTQAQKSVLKQGKDFQGSVTVLNRPFLGVYEPLRDADNAIVGMLFIGEPKTAILKTAGHSIELTFIITAILTLLTIVPAYLVAKYIHSQLE